MATPSSPSLTLLQDEINRRISRLVNTDLRILCREEKLTVSGKKADLLDRIRAKAQTLVSQGDLNALSLLRFRSEHPQHAVRNIAPPPIPSYSNSNSHSDRYAPHTTFSTPTHTTTMVGPRQNMTFKPSAFYTQQRVLGQFVLAVCQNHRNVMTHSITLSTSDANRMLSDQTCRVLLYGAPKNSSQPADIAFPQQLELKVNEHEIKANTRGIKGKAGSTKPVDITAFLKKRPDGQGSLNNKITVTYALTEKPFQMIVYLVEKATIDSLKAQVQLRAISKDRVLKEMRSKAEDPDLVATSFVMSLKDPVSFQRIQIPCRGSLCHHTRCFDLGTYLEMQEQAPQWDCPICSKQAAFSDLAVDLYVKEILDTSKSSESVTIEPDGRWADEVAGKSNRNSSNQEKATMYDDDDSDDDLVEIPGPRSNLVKAESPYTPLSLDRTPVPDPIQSNRPSKRKSEVIDLTISDDDDDEPIAKRRQFANPSGSRMSLPYQQVPSSIHRNPPSISSYEPLSFSFTNSNLPRTTGLPNQSSLNPMAPDFQRPTLAQNYHRTSPWQPNNNTGSNSYPNGRY
ncbi:hypothetical protein BT63DRAFT_416679 [Microthyrium microscopicum]|uniref:E3 SUMO-protein ligase PIAS1 n=1 Tax=Microthyrium microscopicum TaxID=703497 RepID=A0A6A6U3N9_9PEZI|nr:hypothetical protein BT63DRAFT_416679 [Microthyrium microscopicum]